MDVDLYICRDGEREDISLRHGSVRVDPDGTVSRILAPPTLPLDAEQIVRLTGSVLTRVLNAIRHPDPKRVCEAELTLSLARSAGVEVATHGKGWDQRLAPYGTASIPARLDPETA